MSTINSWALGGVPWTIVTLRREYRRRLGPRWWWINTAIGLGTGAAIYFGAKDAVPDLLIKDDPQVKASLQSNMWWVAKLSLAAGATNWMSKHRHPVWGPAHYQRVLNKVFFLRPLLIGATVGTAYAYSRALTQVRRQEFNEAGHFRPVPGQVASAIAATVWSVLWAEGMPHLIAGYALLGAGSYAFDYVYARGMPQWYGQEMNPDDFPMKGTWLAHVRGNLAHNRTYNPNSIYREPKYLPSLQEPFNMGTVNIAIQEARIVNPLGGKASELKNTTLVAARN